MGNQCNCKGVVQQVGKLTGICPYIKTDEIGCGAPKDLECRHKTQRPTNDEKSPDWDV